MVEELVQLKVKGLRPFLQSRKVRRRVPALDAGDVAAEEAGPFLDVALGNTFAFAKFT